MTPIQTFALGIHRVFTTFVFVIFSFVFVCGLVYEHHAAEAALYAVSGAVLMGIVQALKLMTRVARPDGRLVTPAGHAFPSGHAAASTFLAVMVPTLMSSVAGQSLTLLTLIIFVTLAALICWSRLAIKVHTPLQVAAGMLLGFLIPTLFMFLLPASALAGLVRLF